MKTDNFKDLRENTETLEDGYYWVIPFKGYEYSPCVRGVRSGVWLNEAFDADFNVPYKVLKKVEGPFE